MIFEVFFFPFLVPISTYIVVATFYFSYLLVVDNILGFLQLKNFNKKEVYRLRRKEVLIKEGGGSFQQNSFTIILFKRDFYFTSKLKVKTIVSEIHVEPVFVE